MADNYKIILQEDDCAPDVFEFFDKEFLKIMGVSFKDWKLTATVILDDYSIILETDTHIVSCDAGDPYWTLYEKVSE